MTKPLFIIGNKRSGTSQLVRLLNLHPNIFITHESDIVWILFQLYHGQPFAAHPWDSDKGMKVTLKNASALLRRDAAPWENFLTVQRRIMEQGNAWLPPADKTDLRWLGDKKPFQHADPQLLPFILDHFPDAHFLHIVRHPAAVAASSSRFNRTREGDFWIGLSPEEKVERWAFHERQVQELKRDLKERVHSLRYEDLCRRTAGELSGVFDFLKVKADAALLRNASRQTLPTGRAMPKITCSTGVASVADAYRYDVGRGTNRAAALAESFYWRIAKQFGA